MKKLDEIKSEISDIGKNIGAISACMEEDHTPIVLETYADQRRTMRAIKQALEWVIK